MSYHIQSINYISATVCGLQFLTVLQIAIKDELYSADPSFTKLTKRGWVEDSRFYFLILLLMHISWLIDKQLSKQQKTGKGFICLFKVFVCVSFQFILSLASILSRPVMAKMCERWIVSHMLGWYNWYKCFCWIYLENTLL